MIVPEQAVDAQSLIAAADLVISAGGTMNREAVALGVPVYTVFAARLGGVDEQLIREGRLRVLTDPDGIDVKKAGRLPAHGQFAANLAICWRFFFRRPGRRSSVHQQSREGEAMFKGRRSIVPAVIAGAATAAVATVASGGPSAAGYNTSQAPMVTLGAGAPANSSADAIISVGDTMPGGYTFESIPGRRRGLSARQRPRRRLRQPRDVDRAVPVQRELAAGRRSRAEPERLHELRGQPAELQPAQQGITHASKAIASLENYQRFCSNYLATAVEGFDRDILFTNEEAQDWVFRSGTAWPGPTFIPPATAGAEGRRRRRA